MTVIKTAIAKYGGEDSITISLELLHPIAKVFEPPFYEKVKESFRKNGLYYPLIVHPITIKDWEEEMTRDKDMNPPPKDKGDEVLRIQCGCNRWYMLKEMGYDAVSCTILPTKEEAIELCKKTRLDKRWMK